MELVAARRAGAVSGCSYLVTVTGGVTFLLVTRFWSVLNHMVHFVVFESF